MDLLTLLPDNLWPDIPVFHSPVLAVYSKEAVAQIRSEAKSLVGGVVLEAVVYTREADLSYYFG